MMKISALCIALPIALAGCGPADKAPDNSVAANAIATPEVASIAEDSDSLAMAGDNAGNAALPSPLTQWAGRWTGPEGLFLDIAPAPDGKPGHVALTIKDTLDTEGRYAGTHADGTIRFVRNGKAETIRPGTGPQTGFKYLADKTVCLIVQPGKEGYCR